MTTRLVSPYIYRIHYKELHVIWELSSFFLKHIPFDQKHLVFCCIGTDRSTGDALGPLVGTELAAAKQFPFTIIGTLQHPLHALNLADHVHRLAQSHAQPYVIAIDACLGKKESVGHFLCLNGAIQPGSATGKSLPPIGDLAIKGVVNVNGLMGSAILQNTRLSLAIEMSQVLSQSIILAYQRHLFLARHAKVD